MSNVLPLIFVVRQRNFRAHSQTIDLDALQRELGGNLSRCRGAQQVFQMRSEVALGQGLANTDGRDALLLTEVRKGEVIEASAASR